MSDSTSKALPLTEATFLILLSLLPEARHGYAILKEVRALSEGRIRMSTGTLYGALKRLLEQNWVEQIVESDSDQKETRPGRPRRVYVLTELGRRVLQAEASRLEQLSATARLRMEGAQA
jgi:DNA-binding PadR family transcriptional regulator